MLQTSLLLMKSLNKTETPIFLSVVCSLFPKAVVLTFIKINNVVTCALWWISAVKSPRLFVESYNKIIPNKADL